MLIYSIGVQFYDHLCAQHYIYVLCGYLNIITCLNTSSGKRQSSKHLVSFIANLCFCTYVTLMAGVCKNLFKTISLILTMSLSHIMITFMSMNDWSLLVTFGHEFPEIHEWSVEYHQRLSGLLHLGPIVQLWHAVVLLENYLFGIYTLADLYSL